MTSRKPPSQRDPAGATQRLSRAIQSMAPGTMGGRVANAAPVTSKANDAAVGDVSSGGHSIFDEGQPVTDRGVLNFVGGAVTVTDDSVNDRTNVTVSAPTVTQVTHPAPFANRASGDLNRDPATNRWYMLTGTGGLSVVDTFTRPSTAPDSGHTVGGPESGPAYTLVGNYGYITNNRYRPGYSSGGQLCGVFSNIGGGPMDATARWFVGNGNGFMAINKGTANSNASDGYWLTHQNSQGRDSWTLLRNGVSLAATGDILGFLTGDGHTDWRLARVGNDIIATISNSQGTTYTLSYNDASPLTGNYAGIGAYNDGTIDEWQATALGSLAWVAVEAAATLQDEGASLPWRSKVNFIGGAVSLADDSANSRTNVTINAPQSTVSAGLPAFAGRTKGDLHFDLTEMRQYELIGDPGDSMIETWNRANSTTLGSVVLGGNTYAWNKGGALSIVSQQLVQTPADSSTATAYLTISASSTGAISCSVDVLNQANGSGFASGAFVRNDTPYAGWTPPIGYFARTGSTGGGGDLSAGFTPMLCRAGNVVATGSNITGVTGGIRTTVTASAVVAGACIVSAEWRRITDGSLLASLTYNDSSALTGSSVGAAVGWANTVDTVRVELGGTQQWVRSSKDSNIYQTVYDEGGAVTQRFGTNFIGSAVAVTDDAANNRTNVTITSPLSTIGAGLPTFTGRTAGDFHFNETDGREYVLTGVAGLTFTEAFGRADVNPLTDFAGIPIVLGNNFYGVYISSGRLHSQASYSSSGRQLSFTGASGDQDMQVTVQEPVTPYGFGIWVKGTVSGGSNEANGYRLFLDTSGQFDGLTLYRAGTQVATVTLGNGVASSGNQTIRITTTQSGSNVIVKGYWGVTEYLSYTDTSPLTGTRAGLEMSFYGNELWWDNLSYTAAGSLAWTATGGQVVAPTIIDAKGDILVGTGPDAITRLPVGTDTYVLTADSTATNGIAWKVISGGGGSGHIIEDAAGTDLTARGHLQFVGVTVTDDSANDRTIIAMPNAGGLSGEEAAEVLAFETRTSQTFGDLTTPGPSVTIQVGANGKAIVELDSFIAPPSSNYALIGIAVSGATTRAPDDEQAIATESASGEFQQSGGVLLFTGLTPGANTFTMKYRLGSGTAGTATFGRRRIVARPLGSTGGAGHVIENAAGTAMTARGHLQFVGATLTDDAGNDRTIVTITGAPAPTIATKTATYAMVAADDVILANGTFTVTLPAVAGVTPGERYTVKNIGTGTVTIAPVAGTIDGAANKILAVQYSSADFVSDGANWFEV